MNRYASKEILREEWPSITDEDWEKIPEEYLPRVRRKWDAGKTEYSLVLPEFLELMAEILTKGKQNHPPDPDGTPSWQSVEPEAFMDAILRHIQARRMGEMYDHDMDLISGKACSHWGNVAVNAMFLWWFDQQSDCMDESVN